MITQPSHQPLRSRTTRKAVTRRGRLTTLLAAVIAGLLAPVAAATAAFAQPIPIGNDDTTTGGAGPGQHRPGDQHRHGGLADRPDRRRAALAAAAAAVLLDRKLAGRRTAPSTTT